MHSVPATNATPDYQTGTWKADPARSKISFANRMLFAKTRGQFTSYDITIVTSEDPLASSVTATIDLASIDTANAKRDQHIVSKDYVGAKKYPTAVYRSTAIRRAEHGWVVDGDLMFHGVTRQVQLALVVDGFHQDTSGKWRAGFTVTGQISRRDFELAIPMEGGGVVIGDKVDVSFEVLAVQS